MSEICQSGISETSELKCGSGYICKTCNMFGVIKHILYYKYIYMTLGNDLRNYWELCDC